MEISRPSIAFDSLGARLTRFCVHDGQGEAIDVVLAPRQADDLRLDRAAMGAVVGRYAGRIDRAWFVIDGKGCQLAANDGANLLHGGADGFAQREWTLALDHPAEQGLRFWLASPDGDQGFPGELQAQVFYRWQAGEWLEVEILARTSRPTPCNLTQHIYWNLGGLSETVVSDHLLQINAFAFLPVRADMVPTGELRAVGGGPFDFRKARAIGEVLASADPQIAVAGGIDHCWVLDSSDFREVATLAHPPSGRSMAVWTDQPALQVYTANHFGEGPQGKAGMPYPRHAGIALETQGFPDAPNQPHFPDAILRPGQVYRNRTRFVFSQTVSLS
jgi:aldose 1-epimerase